MKIEVVSIPLPDAPRPPKLRRRKAGKRGGNREIVRSRALRDALCEIYSRTGALTIAADHCGVSETFVREWRDDENDRGRLARRLSRARALYLLRWSDILHLTTDKVQAESARFVLERRCPEFARQKPSEVPQTPPPPMVIRFVREEPAAPAVRGKATG